MPFHPDPQKVRPQRVRKVRVVPTIPPVLLSSLFSSSSMPIQPIQVAPLTINSPLSISPAPAATSIINQDSGSQKTSISICPQSHIDDSDDDGGVEDGFDDNISHYSKY